MDYGACERVVGYGLPDCREAGVRPTCLHCYKEGGRALRNLAANLAVAGALCEAWNKGYTYGYQACPCGESPISDEEDRILRLYFCPGHALRPAPGVGES